MTTRKKLSVKPGSWIPVHVPEGYKLADFQRYEDGVVGVLYSGERVECVAPTEEEQKTWLMKLKDMWEALWPQEK